MGKRIIIVMLLSLCIAAANAADMGEIVLSLPRPLQVGEQLSIAISVGPIGRQRIEVSTTQGQYLGTISTFGITADKAGGTYIIPVPTGAVHNARLELHLAITSGSKSRSPTAEEVTAVRLVLPSD